MFFTERFRGEKEGEKSFKMPKRGKLQQQQQQTILIQLEYGAAKNHVLGTRKKTKRNQASKQANKHDLLFKVFEYSL